MKNVIFRAPVLTSSGYGCHSRQIARWLLERSDIKVSFQPLMWGDTPWILDSNAHNGFIGEIMKRTTEMKDCDVSIQLQLPNEWDPKLGKFNVGITAAVETDRCNPKWCDACNNMDLIIVPSNHAKLNLLSHGNVTTPIVIVPEAFSDSCLKSANDLPALPRFSTPFNFLVFGQITGNNPFNDRKNTFFTIKWLLEAFKDNPDVGIVLKTNSGRYTLIDKTNTTNIFKQVVDECRIGPYPRVNLLHGEMSDDEVAALYKHDQIKALVALTRGEGYGLPILEAAASGLPVVATGWSGHLDFLNHGKFINVFYSLTEVHKSRIDSNIFIEGARWAEPSEQEFKKKILKFKDNSSIPKEWAIDLQKKLIERYDHKSIAKIYDDTFKEIF